MDNMNKTPMFFDMSGTSTVETHAVNVKTSGHKKQHFTVKLSCLADETKLKPMVVLKRKK